MKNSLRSSVWKIAVVVMLTFWFTATAPAQNIQFTQGSVGSSLNKSIQIPLGNYPGRGPAVPVNLYWSSQGLWRINFLGSPGYQSGVCGAAITEAIYAEHTTSGWKTSLDLPIFEWPQQTDVYNYHGKAYNPACYTGLGNYRVRRVYVHLPDGSKHELRSTDTPYNQSFVLPPSGIYYAVDGSRIKYDVSLQTLFLSDGSRYVYAPESIKFIDRNGNTLKYGGGQWFDTMGRPIPKPPLVSSPGEYGYSAPGVNDSTVNYVLVWKYLSEALAPGVAGVKPMADYYLPSPGQPPTYMTGNNFPHANQTPGLFHSAFNDSDNETYVVGRDQSPNQPFNPVVLAEIRLPNQLKYQFFYNEYAEIAKVIYPTGAYETYQHEKIPPIGQLSDPYDQTIRGVTSRSLSANGTGNDLATWEYTVDNSQSGVQLITAKAPDNTRTESRRHNMGPPKQPGSNQYYWAFGYEDTRLGLVFDERTYAPNPNGSKGPMMRRALTQYVQTSKDVPPRVGIPGEITIYAHRNVRPQKEVSIILDTLGDALAKTVTHVYDLNYELTTGIDRIITTESYFADVYQTTAQNEPIQNIPAGLTASTAVTTYLNNANYRDQNILGLVTSVVLKDVNLQPVSKSETFYDEVDTFPLIPYDDLAGDEGYTNPGTTARGNATTVRRYIDVNAGTYLETHAQFDQCGNAVNIWNERAVPPFDDANASSRNEYSAAYKHAYLTKTISAIPDPTGAHGSDTPFTSRSTFDYTTGLVLTATDVNEQVTTLSYQNDQGVTDSMNRLRKVTRPDGSWTKYSFGETLGDLFTLTETQLDAGRTIKSYEYSDPLGRASRSFASETGANYLATDTIYDQMGRVWKVSNPYRTITLDGIADPGHTDDWTTSHYDAMSRVDYVTLPDASQVFTSYRGVYTTVTDQAGRQRRVKTDAMGRIVRVDESTSSGIGDNVDAPTQPTFYQYNAQGNLIAISQGLTQAGLNPEDPNSYLQHRYFKYDALGRLTYERQVEQAGMHTAYDPLTLNSAWSRKLVYDETINDVSYKGLLTSAYDARNIRTEFRYDELNRIYQVSYSDGTPTVSNYYDNVRFNVPGDSRPIHNLGRLVEAQTATDGVVPATSQACNYDLMGRAIQNRQSVGSNAYTMGYGYELSGALSSQTYPSGRVVSYTFDAAARLLQVSSGARIYANQFDYSTTQGLLKQVTLGNGAVESFTYNSRLQTKSIDLTKSGSHLQRYDYKYGVYDPDNHTLDESKNTGQIARIEGFIAGAKQWQQNFAYDSLGRLSSAREFRGDNPTLSGKVWLTKYEYDVFGNRYQKQGQNVDNPFTQIWTEDADINKSNNRYAAGLTYDDAGNVLVDSKFRNLAYQYDANNRQKQSSDGTTATVSVYAAGGQRVATQVGGVLTNVLVYDALGKLVAEYGSVPPPPANAGTQFVTSDAQGSPRAITSNGGAIVSRHDYAPFGEEIPGNAGMRTGMPGYAQPDGVRQKYAGMENDDATGMAHTLWRKYDNLSARWTAPDPYSASMSLESPQSFNRYSYVENDPVNHVDPLGLALSDIGILQTDDPELASTTERKSTADLQRSVNQDYAERHGGSVDYKNGKASFISNRTKSWAAQMTRETAAKLSAEMFGGAASQDPSNEDDEVLRINSEPAFLPTVYVWRGQWKFLLNGHYQSTFGHVSYSYGPTMNSWEAAGWRRPLPSIEQFMKENEYRTVDVYVFDFGPSKNRLWWSRIQSAYDGIAVGLGIGSGDPFGYDLLKNNCGSAFLRSLSLFSVAPFKGVGTPSEIKQYIDNGNMRGYLKKHYTVP